MQINVTPIKAYSDNYIWCIHNQTQCCVVDPGDASPVIDFCRAHDLRLSEILITHHHWDHTDGIDDLLNAFGAIPVIGPNNPKIHQINTPVTEGDHVALSWANLNLAVLTVPGHTLDHIAYHSEIGLFCGDTLFSGGCGRLYEGTPEQMHQSLQKLAVLPSETLVYCTHEYTQSNLEFAVAVDNSNEPLHQYQQWVAKRRQQNLPTLPSSIGKERAINPFLRCDQVAVIDAASAHSDQHPDSPAAVFSALRHWKDHY